jgi:hypothetical protein
MIARETSTREKTHHRSHLQILSASSNSIVAGCGGIDDEESVDWLPPD